MKHGSAVGIPSGAVAQAQEPVVEKRGDQGRFTSKDEEDGERHEEYLVEGHPPQDVPGLELHEADEEPGAPPGILAQCVEKGERVGGGVEDGEQDNRHQHEGDGGSIQEYQGEQQVVG